MLRHSKTPMLLPVRAPARSLSKGSSMALRARQDALLADSVLRQIFTEARLNVGQVLQMGRRMQALVGSISLAQMLPLLPPKLAAKIVTSQSEALLHMLLAWGQSLREQSALAQKAQLRRNAQAHELKGHVQTQQLRALATARQLRAAQAQAVDAHSIQRAANSEDGPSAGQAMERFSYGASSLVSGLNRPMIEALSAPLAMGISLRGATLRLSSPG